MSMYSRVLVVYLTGVALLRSVAASPSFLRFRTPGLSAHNKRQVQEITNVLGCGAKGPLEGAWAIELFSCEENSMYTCQATDASGCDVGDASNIESLIVTDSIDSQALGGSASVAEALFQCPSSKMVQCSVRFVDGGAQAGGYGLRVISSSSSNDTSSASESTSGSSSMPTDSSLNTLSNSPSADGSGATPTDSSASEPSESSSSTADDSSNSASGLPTDSGSFTSSSSSESSFASSPTDSSMASSSDM